jgi:hypothetical protein
MRDMKAKYKTTTTAAAAEIIMKMIFDTIYTDILAENWEKKILLISLICIMLWLINFFVLCPLQHFDKNS